MNEVYIKQRKGNFNSFARRAITPAAGQLLGFDATGQLKSFAGGSVTATAGSAGSQAAPIVNQKTALADNTLQDLFTVTVPNALHGGGIEVIANGMLGDGDSVDMKKYFVAVSRIAGANAKVAIGAAVGAGNTTGYAANAATTVSLSAVAGAVGVANTFTVQGKVARSAGASTNHQIVARATLVNQNASGITVVAA